MPNIKENVRYVKFRVSELRKQQQFLHDFGLHTQHRRTACWWPGGTDTSPYIYLAEEGPDPRLCKRWVLSRFRSPAARNRCHGRRSGNRESVSGWWTDRATHRPKRVHGGRCGEHRRGSAALAVADRSGFSQGDAKQRLGERVAFTQSGLLFHQATRACGVDGQRFRDDLGVVVSAGLACSFPMKLLCTKMARNER